VSRSGSEPRSQRALKAPPEPDALDAAASQAIQPDPAQAVGAQPAPGGAQGGQGSPPKTYELGILFIHGMGEQASGDTITQMGDALTEWLRKWLGNDRFKLQNATLRSREGTAAGTASPTNSGRANATVVLHRTSDPPDDGQAWLLAESWWADAFRPASFGELAWWAIGVGPWLIAGQLAGLEDRLFGSSRGLLRLVDWIVFVLLFLIAALVAAVIAPFVVVLLVLSLVPIPFIGGFAQALARNLAGSFGDLLIFVRSPVRFAAMGERVRQDIEWIDSLCERSMVVAHSQGTAVAWHAIRRTAQADHGKPEDARTKLAMFLTFGQAFRKLKALHRLHTRVGRERQLEFALLAFLSTVLLLAMGIAGYYAFVALIAAQGVVGDLGSNAWLAIAVAAIALAFVGVAQWRLSTIAARNDDKAQELILGDLAEVKAELPGFGWLDLWASADPAPNGPLFVPPVPGVASYRIRNMASTALDHSVYWSNTTEFVSAVAFAAGSLAPDGPLPATPIPGRLQRAAAVRNLRVTALAGARVLIGAALVAALIGFRSDLPNVADTVAGWFTWVPFMPDVSGWAGWIRGILGAALIALAFAVAWWLLLAGWNAVVRTDESRFFNRQELVDQPPTAQAWAVVAALVPTLAVVAIAMGQADPTALVSYLVLAALGLLVVVRLMLTPDSRLSDPTG
jgi:hypothetical protein